MILPSNLGEDAIFLDCCPSTRSRQRVAFHATAALASKGLGRPKGARNKLSEDFFEMVCADWAKGGAEAIEKTRREQPGLYFRVVASLMPKQFKVENEFANMTDEQIMQQIRQFDALVAAELGQASIDAVLGEMEPMDRGRQLRRLL
jgi:hypothetical protein